jgi:hypothetical protein
VSGAHAETDPFATFVSPEGRTECSDTCGHILSDYSFSPSFWEDTVPSEAVARSDDSGDAPIDELAKVLSLGTGSGSDECVGMGASGALAEAFNSSEAGDGSNGLIA